MTTAAVAVLVIVGLALARGGTWSARLAGTLRQDLRTGLSWRRVPGIVAASVLVVAGHVGVFLVAARADGSPAPTSQLVPLAMVVLLAMTVPTNIGGWGPREGVAAWALAMAGLGAQRGLETATSYGVLSLVATVPGAVVLLVSRRTRPAPRATEPELVVSGTA